MNKFNPKVTVYITNYNYGKFIEQAICSVLDQTLQDFELIIIDDGSKDNSVEIINVFLTDPRIQFIQQKNKGLNISNNVALNLARGKYIVRLDADDYFKPTALERLSFFLDNDDAVGLIFPDFEEVDAEGDLIRVVKRHDFNTEVELFDLPAHGACTMVRTSFLREVGGYDESFTCQDGFDLWIKFIAKHKVSNVKEILFSYRQHGSNLTKNEDRLLATRSEMKKKYLARTEKNIPQCSIIIPVRSLDVTEIPFTEVNGQTLLSLKIMASIESELCDEVIILTSDEKVKEYVLSHFTNPQIKVIKRPTSYARFNYSLMDSLKLAENSKDTNLNVNSLAVILSLENPFLNSRYIDSSIRALLIFGADSVMSVRRNTKSLYKHDGRTFKSLQSDELTKFERHDIFQAAGGLVCVKIDTAFENDKLLCGVTSHVLVDEISAFEINSQVDLKIANYLGQQVLLDSQSFNIIR